MKRASAPRDGDVSTGESLALLLNRYLDAPRFQRGDVVEGVIVAVDAKTVLVDIGAKCDAVVSPREVGRMMPDQLKALRPGQQVKVYVLRASDEVGGIVVSLARAMQVADWERAQGLLEDGAWLSLEAVGANRGGVIVRLGRLRGFVPASQLSPAHRALQQAGDPDHRWDALVGEALRLRVIEVTPDRNRLILSEREDARPCLSKREVLAKLEVNSVERGVVSNIVSFGAFVNVRGVDGLLHISELAWRRVSHPSEVVQIGQELDVYILDIDLENERLGLSLKRLTPDPWKGLEEVYSEGQLVEVEVVNLTRFGAFAVLVDRPQVEGLIHLSELSEQPVEDAGEVVQVGDRCTVRIISMRPRDRRIAFSLKQAVAPPEEALPSEEVPVAPAPAPAFAEPSSVGLSH